MIDPRNYIPGCASYTKASEISSLQKYLKKGIKKRDEALELPENPEELKKDPLVPEVSELPKGAIGLHDPREVKELPDKSLKIVNPREEALVGHRENIKGAETPDLPETAVGLTDNREAALEDRREDIDVPETTSLVDHREDITNEHDISELPSDRLDINEALTPELPKDSIKTPGKTKEPGSLENTKVKIEGKVNETGSLEKTKLVTPDSETNHNVTSLPKSIVEGPKFRETPLEDHRDEIESNEDPGSLEKHQEKISDKRNVSLKDHKEFIEDRRRVTLENHRENLEDKHRIALEDHREDLEDKRNPKLETHKEGLEDKRNVSLEDHKDILEDKRSVSLEDHREGLEDKRNPKLETKKDVIEDKRNVGLDDTQLKAPGKQKIPELSGTVISGPEVKEVGLEKSRISLEDKRGVTLENHREDITDKRNPKLETYRENITNKRNPELPGTIIGLTDKRNVSLETDRETIEDSRVPELSEVREDIKVPGTPDLPVTSVGLEAGSNVALGEYQEKLTGVQDISGLPGDSEDMPGEISDPELETTKITRPGINSEVALPTDSNKLEGTTEVESLEDERLNLADDRETVLPEGILPIEGEVPETTTLEDTVLERPGETPDLDQIYSDTSGKELYPLEGLDVELPDTRLDITNPNEPFLEDEQLPMEPNASVPGWDGSLEDTVIPDGGDQNSIGWDESLEDERLDIKSPDTPELVTIPKIKSEPEDNWTIEADKNPEGWNEALVTTSDIKAEPEDNWTIEPDLNPEKPGESTDINVILGLETEAIKITPHKIEAPMDPDHAQKFVDTTHNHSFKKELDGVSSSINSEFSEETVIGLKEYGEETEKPETRPDHTDPIHTDNPKWKHIDTTSMSQGDFNEYNKRVKIAQYEAGTPIDPDHAQKFVDTSQNHSFKSSESDGVSSSIESNFSSGTIIGLEEYGKETVKPEARPNHTDPIHTDNPKWKHIDTPSMSQEDFNGYSKRVKMERPLDENIRTADPDHKHNFIDISRNHSFSKDSDGMSSSIESEFSNTSGLKKYGKETEDPIEIMPSQGIAIPTKKDPEADYNALKGPFYWSENNMGRSGWHIDDLAIPAYKLGGSFTSFLNPSKYLRFAVEKTVGVIPLKGSAKQWILDEALAGLIAARDKLEESLNLQPYRLPGSNEYAIQLLRQGMSGVDLRDAKNFVGNAASNLLSKEAVVIKNPINRPYEKDSKYKKRNGLDKNSKTLEVYEAKDGQNGSDAKSLESAAIEAAEKAKKKASEIITKALGSNQGLGYYNPGYLVGGANGMDKMPGMGLKGTLNNFTSTNITEIKSFYDLKYAIENSPYLTSSTKLIGNKVGDIHRHDIALTLDSNHVWEIILEPYLGIENGKYSFLPSIHQINYENFYNFGLATNWDTWIPFTSFELNSKKMVQKNIGLYSGEISIPQNLEFTNELRLVICDDQYKSWKRYFDYVMYASTFLSKTHEPSYYKKKFIKYMGDLTNTFTEDDLEFYQKGVVRPAPYKNLTFRCKIFSMNPQYQTVNMSDLLVVLKDFTEEWQGEVDASPTELALMFSVVGENPIGESGDKDIKTEDEAKLREANSNVKKRSDLFQNYAKKMSDGISITL